MAMRSLGCLAVFIACFCVLMASFCEANRKIPDESSYNNGVHWTTHEINKNTAKQVSTLCKKQLEQIIEAIDSFNLNLPDLTNCNTKDDVPTLRKSLIHKAIIGEPPKVKQSCLRCLKSQRSLSYDLKEEAQQELLLRPYSHNGRALKKRRSRRRGRRRRRRRRSRRRSLAPTAVPSPIPSLVPVNSPAPIAYPNGAPSPTPIPNGSQSPTPTPDGALPPTWNPDGAPSPTPTPNGSQSPTPTPNGALSPTWTPDRAPSPTPIPSPAKALSPTLTPISDGAQSPTITPTPNVVVSPTPAPKNGVLSPTPPPNLAPSLIPEPFPKLPPKLSPRPLPNADPTSQRNSEKPSVLPPEDNSDKRKLLIIVITTTAVATMAVLVLLLICCLKREPKDRRRKGGPLITGSLQRSKKVGSTKDVIHNLSTKGASLPGDQVSGIGPIPPPAGKTTPSTPPSPSPQPPPPPPPPSPPPAPPAPPTSKAPPPPPPPKATHVPTPPKKKPPPPTSLHDQGSSGDDGNRTGDSNGPKTKLKPFFWDKVNASPNRSMVWHEIKAGSFQFNEEMMESLFGYGSTSQNKNEGGKAPLHLQSQPKFIQIIEPKKAQNLAILLKALNVTTEEVSDALNEGLELPVEFISTLLKMAPTQEEEVKLRSYNGDIALLGPSERFLKVLVDIPFAFKRLEVLLFMGSLQEESDSVKESLSALEVACTTLRKSRLFLKLLEAVLKTGNRMNDGTYRGGAQAFKLDTLLKLSDVKGTDGKTTLLSFVVQEIIRSEGIKAARRAKAGRSSFKDIQQPPNQETPEYYRSLGLEVVSKLSEELEDVKKAALVDGDILTSTVLRLGNMLQKTKDFLNNEMKTINEDIEFRMSVAGFVERAEAEIKWLLEEENRIMALVKSTGDYFHGKSKKDEGLRLFVIVRDFLLLLDSICNDIRKTTTMQAKNNQKNGATSIEASSEQHIRRSELFPSNKDSQWAYSSSDDESISP